MKKKQTHLWNCLSHETIWERLSSWSSIKQKLAEALQGTQNLNIGCYRNLFLPLLYNNRSQTVEIGNLRPRFPRKLIGHAVCDQKKKSVTKSVRTLKGTYIQSIQISLQEWKTKLLWILFSVAHEPTYWLFFFFFRSEGKFTIYHTQEGFTIITTYQVTSPTFTKWLYICSLIFNPHNIFKQCRLEREGEKVPQRRSIFNPEAMHLT